MQADRLNWPVAGWMEVRPPSREALRFCS